MSLNKGLAKSLLRRVNNILCRCRDPETDHYKRGIKVHPPWIENPMLFVLYLLKLPNCMVEGYVIDRADNDGHYEPGNLRFVTYSESNRNKRPTGYHVNRRSIQGKTMRHEVEQMLSAAGYIKEPHS